MPKQNFFEIKSARRRHGLVGIKTTVDGNLRCCVDRRPLRVAACVGEDGVQTLGFCISKAKEEICGIGFMK